MRKHEQDAIQEIANALQVTTMMMTKLRRDLWESAERAVAVEAATEKAVRALKRLQPTAKKTR